MIEKLMIEDKKFYNIRCDGCGRLLDEETWWDDREALTSTTLCDCNWIGCEGGRHYCDECWHYDDDDNIVTSDGRRWTGTGHMEIES